MNVNIQNVCYYYRNLLNFDMRGLYMRSIKSFSQSVSLSLALTFDLFFLVMRFMFEFLSISPVSVYSGGSPCK